MVCHIICWYPGDYNRIDTIKYFTYLKYRSKSFEEGGESFVLVAVVTDVTNPEVDEGATKERHM